MTNFHAAAPICSPSRSSIMTGLFAWRVGIAGVYEYGKKDGASNRNDWLNQVPTATMAFRDAGYYTAHVGKWHLGGMRGTDMAERVDAKQCSHPGPNQQGFQEYVSMTEGPEDPRQGSLQRSSRLHSEGGKFLIRNDKPHPCETDSLSNCEAAEAIRIMKETQARNESFYMHVWFEIPHGPWEIMSKFADWYGGARLGRGNRMDAYKTMVSALDESVGRILAALHELDLEQDTIVLFTSDNGPEDNAGTTGGFKNRKRYLHEGGIRVPCIWQWPGHIEMNAKIADFGVGVDIYPTFLEATGVEKPKGVRLDGMSLLPLIAPTSSRAYRSRDGRAPTGRIASRMRSAEPEPESELEQLIQLSNQLQQQPELPLHPSPHRVLPTGVAQKTTAKQRNEKFGHFSADKLLSGVALEHKELDLGSRVWELRSRVAMWYVDYEHALNAAAYSQGFKIITGPKHVPIEVYDLSNDPYEEKNLLTDEESAYWKHTLTNGTFAVSRKKMFVELESVDKANTKSKKDKILHDVVPTLHLFSKYGNAANVLYLKKNYGMSTWHNKENTKLVKLNNETLRQRCGVPSVAEVSMLPFEHADHKTRHMVRPFDYF
jgi:hypothetical protein